MSNTKRRSSRAGRDTSTVPRSPGPTGSVRAGRRDRPRPSYRQQSFLERNRSRLVVGGLVGIIVLAVAFLFLGAIQPTYACSSLTTPAPAASTAPGASPELGQAQPDMGRSHITPGGGTQRYTYCPPASGNHFNITGQGPIPPRFYGPNDSTVPMGWVHNLEHGALVVLYSCANGCPDDATLQKLKDLASTSTFPNGPVSNCPPGAGFGPGPVVARFDQMATKYAALVWDRVLLMDALDTDKIIAFYKAKGERNNPEPANCNPASASPSTAPSAAPSPAPSGAASPSPS